MGVRSGARSVSSAAEPLDDAGMVILCTPARILVHGNDTMNYRMQVYLIR